MVMEIDSGKLVTLQSGHQPQMGVGTEAQKPSTPGKGDNYFAVDSFKIYTCFVNGTWISDERYKLVSTTHDVSVTGNQAIAGAGFAPKGAIITAVVNATVMESEGFTDGTLQYCQSNYYGASPGTWAVFTTNLITLYQDGANYAVAGLVSKDADGITIGWNKTGLPTGIATLLIQFFR